MRKQRVMPTARGNPPTAMPPPEANPSDAPGFRCAFRSNASMLVALVGLAAALLFYGVGPGSTG